MRLLTVLLSLALISCGGSLTDEQRKQMREKMEENKIVRITDIEITEAAFQQGRSTVKSLDSLAVADSGQVAAFVRKFPGDIRFLKPGDTNARMLEQQLVDAYLSDPTGAFQDNVQEVRNDRGQSDTILYTKPVVKKRPDGQDELVGVWNIWISRKELVKAISRTKDH